jgi:hypothetical protein
MPLGRRLQLWTLPAQLTPGIYTYPVTGGIHLTGGAPPTVEIAKLNHWRVIIPLTGNITREQALHGSVTKVQAGLRGDVVKAHLLKAG